MPRWFGERPGKKKDDPPTPDEALANEPLDLGPEPDFEEEIADEPPQSQPEPEEAEAEEEEEEEEEVCLFHDFVN